MRLLSFLAGLSGLFLAGALAAQTTPPPAAPTSPPPPPPLSAENSWHLDLSTGGRVTIQLRPDLAPIHVDRIRTLTRQGFYDGLTFHRVISGFMAQGGDPTGTGSGGSQMPDIPAEIRGLPHVRGAVGMARAEALNSANSQFFIMFVPRLNMDRNYTVFGRVVSGMSFVDAIEQGEPPATPTRIVRASIGTDNVPQMSAEALRAAPARAPQGQTVAALPAAPVATDPPAAAAPDSGSAVPPPAGQDGAAVPAPAADTPTLTPAADTGAAPPAAAEGPAPAPAPQAPPPAPAPAPPPEPTEPTTPPQPPAQAATPPPAPEEAPPPAPAEGEQEAEAPPPSEPNPPPQ